MNNSSIGPRLAQSTEFQSRTFDLNWHWIGSFYQSVTNFGWLVLARLHWIGREWTTLHKGEQALFWMYEYKIVLLSPNSAEQEPLWNSLKFWFCYEHPTMLLCSALSSLSALAIWGCVEITNKTSRYVQRHETSFRGIKQIKKKQSSPRTPEVSVHIFIPKQHLLSGFWWTQKLVKFEQKMWHILQLQSPTSCHLNNSQKLSESK